MKCWLYLAALASLATAGTAGSGPEVLFDNGPYITSDGFSALQVGFDTLGYVSSGYSTTITRSGDDFQVPFNERWTPSSIVVYAYQSGNVRNTFTEAYLGIFDVAIPGTTDLSPRWGSLDPLTATNVLASQVDMNVIRGTAGTSQRNIMELSLTAPDTGVLGEGTYWAAWGLKGTTTTSTVAVVPITPARANDNGVAWGRLRYSPPGRENFWQSCDGNIPTGGNPLMIEANDLAFKVIGTREILPTATVSGILSAPGHSDLTKIMLVAEVREPGTQTIVQTRPVAINVDGTWSFETTKIGAYDLAFKPASYLRVVKTSLTIGADGRPDVQLGDLLGGDIDGDNSVTVFDYDRLSAAFDSAPGAANWDAEADIDGDGTVTVFDYDILSSNFDVTGQD